MQNIPIQSIPNQSFSIILDNNQWSFVLKTTNDVLSVTLTLNNNIVIENMRAIANEIIIPCQYQESGNFVFLTQNFLLPDYTQFGITQSLVYLSAEELVTFRTSVSIPITAADFNPIATLPLRFAPELEGYVKDYTILAEGNGNILLEGGINIGYALVEGSAEISITTDSHIDITTDDGSILITG